VVEADETFIGREPGTQMKRGGFQHKMKVLALVDRSTGRSRAMVVDHVDTATIKPILLDNISREASLCTDESVIYRRLGGMFADRARVDHSRGEYVNRDDPTIQTNSVEGYFSIFKRGMKGVYQHCAKKHLHRYLAEFDFRYSNREACGYNDLARADELLKGVVGASCIKHLVGGPRSDAQKETGNDLRGTVRAIQSRGQKANRRWRTQPHRGRRGV
jgi:hypothetical protein